MSLLSQEYFVQEDVVSLARDLLGKVCVTHIDERITSGVITETEAYAGVSDKASHAFGGKRTKRTETMYFSGGVSYVYLCYGMHHLFNFVTGPKDVPHAVLLRAIHPLEGISTMEMRRNRKCLKKGFTSGPGTAAQALGITIRHNALTIGGKLIQLEDQGIKVPFASIIQTPRIGVDYAGEDAKLPYRFVIDTKCYIF